jgi:hypothetical protein
MMKKVAAGSTDSAGFDDQGGAPLSSTELDGHRYQLQQKGLRLEFDKQSTTTIDTHDQAPPLTFHSLSSFADLADDDGDFADDNGTTDIDSRASSKPGDQSSPPGTAAGSHSSPLTSPGDLSFTYSSEIMDQSEDMKAVWRGRMTEILSAYQEGIQSTIACMEEVIAGLRERMVEDMTMLENSMMHKTEDIAEAYAAMLHERASRESLRQFVGQRLSNIMGFLEPESGN